MEHRPLRALSYREYDTLARGACLLALNWNFLYFHTKFVLRKKIRKVKR